jgi:hypothetical protein
MFDELDAALTRLLDRAGAPAELRAADVSFETPGKDFKPSLPTINLFFYEASEDVDLRALEPRREDTGTRVIARQPPMRAECQYLLTAWAPAGTDAALRVGIEHELLGLAMAWLTQFPVLPDDVMGQALASQPAPIPLRVGRHVHARETVELWNALGAPPRPGAWVAATISLELKTAGVDAPRVDAVELRLDDPLNESSFALAGRVVEAGTTHPVPGARLELKPTGRSATTDASGRFRFANVRTGGYELTVAAPGYKHQRRSVVVPPDAAGAYDTELAPAG